MNEDNRTTPESAANFTARKDDLHGVQATEELIEAAKSRGLQTVVEIAELIRELYGDRITTQDTYPRTFTQKQMNEHRGDPQWIKKVEMVPIGTLVSQPLENLAADICHALLISNESIEPQKKSVAMLAKVLYVDIENGRRLARSADDWTMEFDRGVVKTDADDASLVAVLDILQRLSVGEPVSTEEINEARDESGTLVLHLLTTANPNPQGLINSNFFSLAIVFEKIIDGYAG